MTGVTSVVGVPSTHLVCLHTHFNSLVRHNYVGFFLSGSRCPWNLHDCRISQQPFPNTQMTSWDITPADTATRPNVAAKLEFDRNVTSRDDTDCSTLNVTPLAGDAREDHIDCSTASALALITPESQVVHVGIAEHSNQHSTSAKRLTSMDRETTPRDTEVSAGNISSLADEHRPEKAELCHPGSLKIGSPVLALSERNLAVIVDKGPVAMNRSSLKLDTTTEAEHPKPARRATEKRPRRRRKISEKRFLCSVCGNAYTHKTQLTYHCRKHTGEKPFECLICGVRFSLKSSLDTHQRVHTGEKAFECLVCTIQFSKRSDLNSTEALWCHTLPIFLSRE